MELEADIQQPLESDQSLFDSSISAKKLITNGPTKIKSADIDFINNLKVQDILDNVLDMNEGFEIENKLYFQIVDASEPIIVEMINNVTKTDLIHTDADINFDDVLVQGDVQCESNLRVAETINDIKFDTKNLLLRNVDQNFSEFSVDHLVVRKDDANVSLNNSNTDEHEDNVMSSIKEMKVKDLWIKEYINGVKISTLNKYALRNSGDQEIVVPCYFNHLEAGNLETKELSGKKIHHF